MKKSVSLFVAILWLLTPAIFGQQVDEPVDLIAISQHLIDWRNSFENLSVTWEITTDWEGSDVPTDSSTPGVREEWIWTDHGLSFYQSAGILSQRRTFSVANAPANLWFEAIYEKEVLKKLYYRGSTTLSTYSGDSFPFGLAKPSAPIPFFGLYSKGTNEWLGTVIQKGDLTIDGLERIGDVPYIRIVDKVNRHWLDPHHGYLVKRSEPLVHRAENQFVFQVDEFNKLETGQWFPGRGIFHSCSNSFGFREQWRIVNVRMNSEPDLRRLEMPKLPIGSEAINLSKGGLHFIRSDADRAEFEKSITDQPETDTAVSSVWANIDLFDSRVYYDAVVCILFVSAFVVMVAAGLKRLRRVL